MKFIVRSLLILLLLYGIVFALGDLYLAHQGASVWAALLFAGGLIGFQYLVSPWLIEFFFDIVWDDKHDDLPAENRVFIEHLCAQRGLKVPRIGIIYSGTPNAFSFGRLRRDARIVVTKGLLEVLTPDEANAVLAHELGHIEHYDFLVMTVAALVPLLLYQIYVFTNKISNTRTLAYGAYLCYWISQYVVLLLNRTREFFADHYAAEVTQQPDALASGLVKVAYGLVRADGRYRESLESNSKEDKERQAQQHRLSGAIALMGICNVRSGAALALGVANPRQAAAVMRWDLVNPWARVYELGSTHPLTALRVQALQSESASPTRTVEDPLRETKGIRWGQFPLELAIWAAPWLCFGLLVGKQIFDLKFAWLKVAFPESWEPVLLIATGMTWILRIWYRYRGAFQEHQIESLLEDLNASEMQPRAVRLRGEIVGRGVPGAFWSPDLVLQDATGLIFLQYRQSIPFARLLFAIREADQYIGAQIEVEGWFRRGLTPYVEMSRLTDGSSLKRAYSRQVQYGLAGAMVLIGLLWLS